MGILIFTLFAVALGCGMGSKARKDRKQREKRLRQGSIPAPKPFFTAVDQPSEVFKKPFESEEAPFEPEASVSDTFGDVPEDSLETMEPEQDAPVPEPETLPEPPLPQKAEVAPSTEKSGFSLREAVIAQTVLERKFH